MLGLVFVDCFLIFMLFTLISMLARLFLNFELLETFALSLDMHSNFKMFSAFPLFYFLF